MKKALLIIALVSIASCATKVTKTETSGILGAKIYEGEKCVYKITKMASTDLASFANEFSELKDDILKKVPEDEKKLGIFLIPTISDAEVNVLYVKYCLKLKYRVQKIPGR